MKETASAIAAVSAAARDSEPIRGLTHCFYRYPARFSPVFARTAIEAYSAEGDIVLDPFMGGGTTVLEAMRLGRKAVGSDVNSLAVFVTQAKTTILRPEDQREVLRWAQTSVPHLRAWQELQAESATALSPRNMNLPGTRSLKRTLAQCLESVVIDLRSPVAQRFARCVLLNVGQWALNGRKRMPTASDFRERVEDTCYQMLAGMRDLGADLQTLNTPVIPPTILETDAENLVEIMGSRVGCKANLIVTSPPYPGIHMLYHRWQVDGRKETDAPYWIAGCADGSGPAVYNFASRSAEDLYIAKAGRVFTAIREMVKPGAHLVQLIAFANPRRQLPRYLGALDRAGFTEKRDVGTRRTWRSIPGRRWHANFKGKIPSSNEVLLVHRAE